MDTDSLKKLQKESFDYFVKFQSSLGLIADSSLPNSPSSITAVGLGLSAFCIAVENKFISRNKAINIILKILNLFWKGPQSAEQNAMGYKGFFYHFIEMKTGIRANTSELSSIDTAFFIVGALSAAQYFNKNTKQEKKIRHLANALYKRVNWKWMLNKGDSFAMSWKPESGFQKSRWVGYDESLILYILGLAASKFSIQKKNYLAWQSQFEWKTIYDIEFLYAGSLSLHHLSYLWIDPRNIQDEYMQKKAIDYYENTRRATYIQQQYAILNPKKFKGYNANCWGITPTFGPGPCKKKINGRNIKFYAYKERIIPYGIDDGTIAPRAVVCSLPFAPEIAFPCLSYILKKYPRIKGTYGFKASLNPTFYKRGYWVPNLYFGLAQGSDVIMIENYKTGLIWRLMRKSSIIKKGLKKAGFKGGWL